MQTGKLTGVGVGPGDPEHITLKALKAIRDADVLMLPAKNREECRAYVIAEKACAIFNQELEAAARMNNTNSNEGNTSDDASDNTQFRPQSSCSDGTYIDMSRKECLFEPFPMKMDKQELDSFHLRVGDRVKALLNDGRNVVFLTIGDPCIYSTFHYIEAIIRAAGYETEWVNGIPSYCASAGRLKISLAQNNEAIHIIPGKYDTQSVQQLEGTKIIMKPSRTDSAFREYIRQAEEDGCSIYWVSQCGLDNERVACSSADIPDDMGYMSVVIIKDIVYNDLNIILEDNT